MQQLKDEVTLQRSITALTGAVASVSAQKYVQQNLGWCVVDGN